MSYGSIVAGRSHLAFVICIILQGNIGDLQVEFASFIRTKDCIARISGNRSNVACKKVTLRLSKKVSVCGGKASVWCQRFPVLDQTVTIDFSFFSVILPKFLSIFLLFTNIISVIYIFPGFLLIFNTIFLDLCLKNYAL